MQATTPDSSKPFRLTQDQEKANKLLGSDARHIMLYGGSRSGKTFLILRAIVIRALAHQSRHAVLRYRFNHIKGSVIYDTLPKMMDLCWPGLWQQCHLDKSDWFLKLPNGSEVWFGGLDDKERTEKILGNEFATIFLNECSQIPWASRNMAITRLAQNTPLRLKMYYDCNPPSEVHWTCSVFVNKLDPDTRIQIRDKDNYAALVMNPVGNRDNLPADYITGLEGLPSKMRQRFLLGQFQTAADNALWTYALLDKCRVLDSALPDMVRILVVVDPSGCSGAEDTRSDEVGMVVVGLGSDGNGYLLEDLSGHMAPNEWGQAAVAAFDRHEADAVVAETNFGGAMVGEVIKAARSRMPGTRAIPFKEVHASRGKVVRAEPISALYEQGKVRHIGFFERLEEQLCAMTTAGYMGSKSPDRADALIWGLHEIFPGVVRKEQKFSRVPQVNLGYSKHKQTYRQSAVYR